MIAALQKDDALLADLASAKGGPEVLHVWWLGQSGFLVQWNGQRLLFDPYLSDSLTIKLITWHGIGGRLVTLSRLSKNTGVNRL